MKTSKFKMTLAVVAAAAALVGCGGNDSNVVPFAGANVTSTITAAAPGGLNALRGATFTFPAAITGLTTAASTIAFGGTPGAVTATVTSGGVAAEYTVTAGSCVFTPTPASLAANPALTTVIVNPCSFVLPTAGNTINVAVTELATLNLGTTPGTGNIAAVTVNSQGQVSVGGVVIGTVAVTDTTGASSGAR